MKRLICTAMLGLAIPACGQPGTGPRYCPDANRMVDAIWHAEGGNRAKIPYGILAVRVHSTSEARSVCLVTVQRALARWRATGTQDNAVEFVSNTYCPVSCDPVGHWNWIRNVKWFLNHP